jgi:hypothetical protein
MGTIIRGRLLVGTVLAVVVLAVAVACGGGGDEEATVAPSPGATGTPVGTPTAVPSELEDQLKGMVLQLSDMPAGFSLAQEGFSTNQDVAGDGENAQATLAKVTEWGRILGHGVVFSADASAESGVLLVDSTVSLYQSDSGAVASFADALDTARTTDWEATVGEATDVSVEEVPPLDVADEMFWIRISGTALVGEPASEHPFIQDIILLRVGRARGSVSVLTSAADAAVMVENMVRTQAANMAAGVQ